MYACICVLEHLCIYECLSVCMHACLRASVHACVCSGSSLPCITEDCLENLTVASFMCKVYQQVHTILNCHRIFASIPDKLGTHPCSKGIHLSSREAVQRDIANVESFLHLTSVTSFPLHELSFNNQIY